MEKIKIDKKAIDRIAKKITDDMENEKYYLFLDDLKESGATNMFGARPYLMKAFPELSKDEAGKILSDWMNTFSERHKD